MAMTDSFWCWFLWDQKQFTGSASAPLIKTGMCVFASFFFLNQQSALWFCWCWAGDYFPCITDFLSVMSYHRLKSRWCFLQLFHILLPKTVENEWASNREKSQYYEIFWFSWSFNCTITDVPLIVFALYKHGGRFSNLMLGWKDASQRCDRWYFHKVEKTSPFMT